MDNDITPEGNRIEISEGVMLAIVTGIAYLHVYLSELGYHQYFNIPNFFIRLSIEQILLRGLYILIIGLSIFFTISVWIYFRRRLARDYLLFDSQAVEFLLLITFSVILFSEIINASDLLDPKYEGPILLATTIILIWGGTYILFYYLGKKKSSSEDNTNNFQEPKMEISFLSLKLKPNLLDILLIFFILVVVFGLSYERGYSRAQRTEEYFVTNTYPENVVLINYGEYLVCAHFNRKTNEVHNTFSVLRIGDDPEITLTLERLGRLHSQELNPP